MNPAVFLLVVGLSVWVYFDAKAIGVRKGLMPGPFDMTPLGWAGLCFFLWIVWFPLYLSKRGRLRALAQADRAEAVVDVDDDEEESELAEGEPRTPQADDDPAEEPHAGGESNEPRAARRRRARRRAAPGSSS